MGVERTHCGFENRVNKPDFPRFVASAVNCICKAGAGNGLSDETICGRVEEGEASFPSAFLWGGLSTGPWRSSGTPAPAPCCSLPALRKRGADRRQPVARLVVCAILL